MKNFKKVISAVIALAMFASSIATVGASKYTDVADTAAYAEAVEVLTALGIVTGYEENGTYTFKPEGTITRAEAATMIVGALNMTEDAKASAGTSQFADVNANAAWAAGYINVGVAQGFIKGMDATTFAPQDNVTYAQMCVMLTTIAGYGEYAAANSTGTWSSGYTSMAASTGINKGVAAADDTALTRGQVAMMIYNTLVTPMLGVAEYSLTGNSYAQLDGKNGREFKTLLSDKFDGYIATILIQETPISDTNLESDEVTFDIQKADYWYEAGSKIAGGVDDSLTSYANQTELFADNVDVTANLKQIGKAIFVHNDDDELVLVYFAATGKTATREFDADAYVMQKELADKNQYSSTNKKIRFDSKYFNLEDTVTVYVNGTQYATITNEADNTATNPRVLTTAQAGLDKYLGNAMGTITLLDDGTNAGYEVIMVEIWNVAEVLGVEYENGQTVVSVYTKNALDVAASYDEIVIDDEYVEEGKTKVLVKRNDQDAELTSLVKGDIIAYKSEIGTSGDTALSNPKVVEILATNETVAGKVTSEDPDEKTNVVGGTTYESVVYGTPSLTMGETYTITLDPFGRIYDAEKDGSADLYAIALDVTSDERIKLVLADGTTKTYEVDGQATITGFGGSSVSAIDSYLSGKAANLRVVKYKVRNSTGEITKIELATASENAWVSGDQYKSRTGILGTSKIASTTDVIDASNAVGDEDSASGYTKFNNDTFKDGTKYKYVSFKSGTYTAFVVIAEVGTKINAESRFAVVRKTPNTIETEDGDRVDSVIVLLDGDDEKELLFNEDVYTDNRLEVGDAFYYELDAYGYVKDVFVIYDESTGTYTDLATALTAKSKAGYIETASSADEFWAFDLDNSTNRADVQLVEGYVVTGESKSIAFAAATSPLYKIDTTADLKNAADGIVFYGVDEDTDMYLFNKSNTNIVKNYDKFSAKTDASALSSTGLAKYEDEGIYGVGPAYTTDMSADANYAIAMIVDEVVVAIYVIK